MAHNEYNRYNGQYSDSALDLYSNEQQFLRSSKCHPPKPLQTHKKSSQQLPSATIQRPLNDNNTHSQEIEQPIFPPRRSSIYTPHDFNAFESSKGREGGHLRLSSENSAIQSIMSSNRSNPFSNMSFGDSSPHSVTRSTVSSHRQQYLSDASLGIIGNFIPIDEEDVSMSGPLAEVTIPFREALSKNGQIYRAANPHEFEPDSPYLPNMRQTTFSDFMIDTKPMVPTASPRSLSVKHAYSHDNTEIDTRASTPQPDAPLKANGFLARSESSPNIPHGYSFQESDHSPDILDHYTVNERVCPHQRGRAPSVPTQSQYQQQVSNQQGLYVNHKVCSPTKLVASDEPRSQPQVRGRTRSPIKTLRDVEEADELDIDLKTPTIPQKKRSRSPMKKMFGENGWLGKSPNELDIKNRMKPRKEKTSMMEKLKHKFEELAEKADLSPKNGPRSSREKHAKISVLSVSLSPPEQARTYMEVELMLVHTANVFLMLQFSQGRMAVDSIKKTVDGWKSKGRPVVIEFMYDQATQRDLVVANQNNFRFHGERAGDEMRISSMLYNWKNVASLMTVRTFCDADTVILKLLFDIEQILEFLGARDPILYRLQQIRASCIEMMRISRQKKEAEASVNIYGARMYRNTVSSSGTSAESSSRAQSMDDPCGGMKLVADGYME